MQTPRLKIKEPKGAKWGEEVLAYAIPVLICNRMMGRDAQTIDHMQSHIHLGESAHPKQARVVYDQIINANTKRVLSMTYSLAAQVRQAHPETLIADLETGLAFECGYSRDLVLYALLRAGRFIEVEKYDVAELNAWKQFFSVEVAKQGEWDNHNLSEFNIGKHLR